LLPFSLKSCRHDCQHFIIPPWSWPQVPGGACEGFQELPPMIRLLPSGCHVPALASLAKGHKQLRNRGRTVPLTREHKEPHKARNRGRRGPLAFSASRANQSHNTSCASLVHLRNRPSPRSPFRESGSSGRAVHNLHSILLLVPSSDHGHPVRFYLRVA
jgi:hypothetical protein